MIRGILAATAIAAFPFPSAARAADAGIPDPAGTDVSAGAWGPAFAYPLIPIHMVLTPEGKVVSFGSGDTGAQGGRLFFSVWDPALGTGPAAHALLPNPTATDVFCAAQVLLPSGKVLVVGGDDGYQGNVGNAKITVVDAAAETMSNGGFTMAYPRWYPTATILPNGEVLVQGGKGDGTPDIFMTTPEIFNPRTGWRSLFGAMSDYAYGVDFDKWWYPRSWVLPDGRVFGLTGNAMYYLDWSGDGRMEEAGSFEGLNRGKSSTAVMYAPGKILQLGGGRLPTTFPLGSKDATLIDANGPRPVLTPAAPLHFPRHWGNTTLLPDGKVLVTGGSDKYNSLEAGGASQRGEIWDPAGDTWTLTPPETYARLYHSTALLLPDATVLSAGGGAAGPLSNLNGQIYYPPCLFEGGKPASRPSAEVAVKILSYGGVLGIRVRSSKPIARVTMVKTGAVTHSFNNEQRIVELPFRARKDILFAQLPRSPRSATPGYYLLFVIDSRGVPSVAPILQLAPPAGAADGKAAAPDKVRDGGFGAPLPSGGRIVYRAGRGFGAWTVASGSAAHLSCGVPDAGGRKGLELIAGSRGAVCQTLRGLVPGAVYALTFDYARRNGPGGKAYAAVRIAGLRKSWSASNEDQSDWIKAVHGFTAAAATEKLCFLDEGAPGGSGMLIDDAAAIQTGDPAPAPIVEAYPWKGGKSGLAMDGTGTYGRVKASPRQNVRRGLTVSARVRPSALGDVGILVKGAAASPYGLRLRADGTLSLVANRGSVSGGSGRGEWRSRAAVRENRWQHVAATYDGIRVRFYVDGLPDPGGIPAEIAFGSTPEPIAVGCDPADTGDCFSGAIADARVYDQALSEGQIKSLAQVPGGMPEDPVVDKFPWKGGRDGFVLDGGSAFEEVPHDSSHNASTELTLAARIKADAFRAGDGLIVKGAGASPYALQVWDNRSLRFSANQGSARGGKGGGSWNSAVSLTEGTWHHVAVTHDGSGIRFYVDGVPGDYQPAAGITFGASEEPLFIGRHPAIPEAFFTGAIADAKVFTRALSASEIAALAAVTDPAPHPRRGFPPVRR